MVKKTAEVRDRIKPLKTVEKPCEPRHFSTAVLSYCGAFLLWRCSRKALCTAALFCCCTFLLWRRSRKALCIPALFYCCTFLLRHDVLMSNLMEFCTPAHFYCGAGVKKVTFLLQRPQFAAPMAAPVIFLPQFESFLNLP